MEVFISWSGKRSNQAALNLYRWLPKVINAIKPWMSTEDISKGARWASDIGNKLESTRFGILCVTPSNLHSDWLLFEAGALAKQVSNSLVCPLLIDLSPAELVGPLAQFQATQANKPDLKRLVFAMNAIVGSEGLRREDLEDVFEVWWPKLENDFAMLPVDNGSEDRPRRSERDLLEELLAAVREQSRLFQPAELSPRIRWRTVSYLTDLVRSILQDRTSRIAELGLGLVTLQPSPDGITATSTRGEAPVRTFVEVKHDWPQGSSPEYAGALTEKLLWELANAPIVQP